SYGLQLNGVAIKYERMHSGNGHSWRTLEVDRYPQNVSEAQPLVLTLTVELAGSRSQSISQKIVTRTIDLEDTSWWKLHLPALENLFDDDLQILAVERTSALPRELLEGCIAEWMDVEAEWDVVRATVSYATESGTVNAQEIAVRILATDAVSRTYTHVTAFEGEEDTPDGLAQTLYESFATCPHEGSAVLVGEEIFPVSMGNSVNVVGSRPAWATMNADIQECIESVDDGTVKLRFGPPAHLGLQQLVQLTRMNRGREAPRTAWTRVAGEGGAGEIQQPTHTAAANTHVGATTYGKILFTHSEDSTRQMNFDADLIALSGLVLQPREEYVVENGELKMRLTIASQNYDIEE
ncbi:MAG: hypothetical protein LBC42_03955, partial [Puniceicoccales bacterium]|nr:hypothetical protein [Puniceicoccales bacterium]